MLEITRVLVGLISHNRFNFTKDAVASIVRTDLPFDFLIVDCGSEADTKKDVFLLSHSVGARFASIENRNCNGARDVINHYGLYYDYIVYIDNDALPPSGWLEALVQAGQSSGAAIIGAPQAEADSGTPAFVGSFAYPHDRLVVFKECPHPLTRTERLDWVTGNCMAVRGSFLRKIWRRYSLWERWKKFPIDLDDIDVAMMARSLGETVVAAPIVVRQNRSQMETRESDGYRRARDDFHNYALSCVSFWKEWHLNPLLNWNSGYTATNYKPGRIHDRSLADEFSQLVEMVRELDPAIYDVLKQKAEQ